MELHCRYQLANQSVSDRDALAHRKKCRKKRKAPPISQWGFSRSGALRRPVQRKNALAELSYDLFEVVPALFVAIEHIEARGSWRQQDRVADAGFLIGDQNRFLKGPDQERL